MEIEVFRPKQLADMTRDYTLCADGKKIATLKRGESQMVSVPEGTKKLRANIDWCSSQEIDVAELTSKKVVVKNAFAGNALKTILLSLYYISFGRRKYLKIESVS